MEEAFKTIIKDRYFEELTGINETNFDHNSIEHHRAVSEWAKERLPPFGNNKDKRGKKLRAKSCLQSNPNSL